MLSSFILKHGRVISFVLVGVLVSGLSCYGGFVEGKKRATPTVASTKEETKVVERQLQNIVQQVDLQALTKIIQDTVKNAVKDVKTNTVITTKTVKAPDGTTTTERTEATAKESHAEAHSEAKTSTTAETKQQDHLQLQTKTDLTIDRKVETVFVPQLREPTWNIGVGFGVNVPALLGRDAPTSYLPFLDAKYVAELKVAHHLLGPTYFGAKASTRGDLLFVLEYLK